MHITTLIIPRTKHSSIADRAFSLAALRVWNILPVTDGYVINVTANLQKASETEQFIYCMTDIAFLNVMLKCLFKQ